MDVSMTLPAAEAAATRKTHHRPARSPRERGLTRGRGQHSPHRNSEHGYLEPHMHHRFAPATADWGAGRDAGGATPPQSRL